MFTCSKLIILTLFFLFAVLARCSNILPLVLYKNLQLIQPQLINVHTFFVDCVGVLEISH